mgnify:CR=1 FL=1
MSSPTTRLVVSGATKDFGYQRVLKGIDLTVEEGEYVALMGPNGAGKTTLLRLAAGLSTPSSGSVSIAGVDLGKAGPGLKRRIGFVSHESMLYPDLTGRENLAFHAELFGVTDLDEQLAVLDELLDLAPILERPAGVLSRGNRQRLTLARALLHAPRILLLDEPFTGLDEASTERLLDILQRLVADGRTVIMTTHDRAILDAGPRRLVVISNGVVSEDRPITPKADLPVPRQLNHEFLRPKLTPPPKRLGAALAIARKDLRVELRTRDQLGASGLFALCVLITSSFTMPPGTSGKGFATGILWISILFAVLLGVGRAMGKETADRGIEGLLLSPASRESIFVGKALGSLLLMLVLGVFTLFVFIVTMAGQASIDFVSVLLTLVLGVFGLVVVGSLFAGIAIGSRMGETLLPLISIPVLLPLMIGAVELTNLCLQPGSTGLLVGVGLLAAYDLMVTMVAVITFTHVVEE